MTFASGECGGEMNFNRNRNVTLESSVDCVTTVVSNFGVHALVVDITRTDA